MANKRQKNLQASDSRKSMGCTFLVTVINQIGMKTIKKIEVAKTVKSPAFILTILCIVGAILRLAGTDYGLPQILHPDEPHIVDPTLHFYEGDLNPHTFVYTSFLMYVQYAAQRLYLLIAGIFVHIEPSRTMAYFIGRIVTALFGTATIVVVYKLGKKLFDKNIGLLAALLITIVNSHVNHSHYATTDVPLTFFILLGVYIGWLLLETGKLKYYIWSGVITGLAISTKIPGVFLLLVLAAAHIVYTGRQQKLVFKSVIREEISDTRTMIIGGSIILFFSTCVFIVMKNFAVIYARLVHVLPNALFTKFGDKVISQVESTAIMYALVIAVGLLLLLLVRKYIFTNFKNIAIAVALALLVFFITSPFVFIDWKVFLTDFFNAVLNSKTSWGGMFRNSTPSIIYNVSFLVKDFGIFTMLVVGFSVLYIIYKKSPQGLFLLVFVVAYYLYIGTWQLKFMRYLVPIVPFIALFAGHGFLTLLRFLQKLRKLPRLVRAMAYGIVCFTIAFPGFVYIVNNSYGYELVLISPDTREVAFDWMKENIPQDAHILREAYTPEIEIAGYKVINVFYDFHDIVDEDFVVDKKIDYLVISSQMFERYLNNGTQSDTSKQNYLNIPDYAEGIKIFKKTMHCFGPEIKIYKVFDGDEERL